MKQGVAACSIQIIINALEEMNLKFPELSAEDKAGLAEAKDNWKVNNR
ncbi:MAG: hypothetical protein U0T85_07110 [Cloacibacterium normanense]